MFDSFTQTPIPSSTQHDINDIVYDETGAVFYLVGDSGSILSR